MNERKVMTLAIIIGVAAILMAVACATAPGTNTGSVADGSLSYYHDPQTALCFAVWRASNSHNSGVGLVKVDCTDGVLQAAGVYQ